MLGTEKKREESSTSDVREISFLNKFSLRKSGSITQQSLAVYDVDSDGKNEFIYGTFSGALRIIKYDKTLYKAGNLGSITCLTCGTLDEHPILVVINCEGEMHFFNLTRSTLKRKPSTLFVSELMERVDSGDISLFDDSPDVDENLRKKKEGQQLIKQFHSHRICLNVTCCCIMDINGNGENEIIVGTSARTVFVYRFRINFKDTKLSKLEVVEKWEFDKKIYSLAEHKKHRLLLVGFFTDGGCLITRLKNLRGLKLQRGGEFIPIRSRNQRYMKRDFYTKGTVPSFVVGNLTFLPSEISPTVKDENDGSSARFIENDASESTKPEDDDMSDSSSSDEDEDDEDEERVKAGKNGLVKPTRPSLSVVTPLKVGESRTSPQHNIEEEDMILCSCDGVVRVFNPLKVKNKGLATPVTKTFFHDVENGIWCCKFEDVNVLGIFKGHFSIHSKTLRGKSASSNREKPRKSPKPVGAEEVEKSKSREDEKYHGEAGEMMLTGNGKDPPTPIGMNGTPYWIKEEEICLATTSGNTYIFDSDGSMIVHRNFEEDEEYGFDEKEEDDEKEKEDALKKKEEKRRYEPQKAEEEEEEELKESLEIRLEETIVNTSSSYESFLCGSYAISKDKEPSLCMFYSSTVHSKILCFEGIVFQSVKLQNLNDFIGEDSGSPYFKKHKRRKKRKRKKSGDTSTISERIDKFIKKEEGGKMLEKIKELGEKRKGFIESILYFVSEEEMNDYIKILKEKNSSLKKMIKERNEKTPEE